MRKILRYLLKAWEVKLTAIQEANDLNTLALDELLDSLMTYELTQKQHAQDDEERKIKIVAFKSTKKEEKSENNGDNGFHHSQIQTIHEEEIERCKRNEAKGEPSKEATIICYECKKSRHIKVDCPMLKKEKKKKKGRWRP